MKTFMRRTDESGQEELLRKNGLKPVPESARPAEKAGTPAAAAFSLAVLTRTQSVE